MIDLHAHTTVSDGGDDPRELVRVASSAGLSAIAVTDHDNDAGCGDAIDEGTKLGIEVVPGVEISCDVEDLAERGFNPTARPTMHLLGYCIPRTDNELSAALADLQYHRANRNRIIVDRLNELGVNISFEEVEAEAGGPGSQIGRPHFAAVMVRHNAVPDYQTAFDEYLAKGAKAYIGRKLYLPAEAVELMTRVGVVPVLAHPLTMNISFEEIERFADELVEAGLEGIEGYHGDWSLEEQAPLRAYAERRDLIASGGSDYHGAMRPDRRMPGGKFGVAVPEEALDRLKSAAAELRG